MFGELNKIRVHNEGSLKLFNRGSFFFREKRWTPKEMAEKMIEIAESSVLYYFSKYKKEIFI
jgi:type II restriction enzyme